MSTPASHSLPPPPPSTPAPLISLFASLPYTPTIPYSPSLVTLHPVDADKALLEGNVLKVIKDFCNIGIQTEETSDSGSNSNNYNNNDDNNNYNSNNTHEKKLKKRLRTRNEHSECSSVLGVGGRRGGDVLCCNL
jgi:hypothetical protein